MIADLTDQATSNKNTTCHKPLARRAYPNAIHRLAVRVIRLINNNQQMLDNASMLTPPEA